MPDWMSSSRSGRPIVIADFTDWSAIFTRPSMFVWWVGSVTRWNSSSHTFWQKQILLDACRRHGRLTSGLHMCLHGPNTCFRIVGASKRQGCVSHSTPEAEILVTDFALRRRRLPALNLWHKILPHKPGLVVHEDNQAMIHVVETDRNLTMRSIGRTHGVRAKTCS